MVRLIEGSDVSFHETSQWLGSGQLRIPGLVFSMANLEEQDSAGQAKGDAICRHDRPRLQSQAIQQPETDAESEQAVHRKRDA